jgi:hypothetical protein
MIKAKHLRELRGRSRLVLVLDGCVDRGGDWVFGDEVAMCKLDLLGYTTFDGLATSPLPLGVVGAM